MSKVEEPVHQPTLNLWTAVPAAVPAVTDVLPGAEIYAGATPRPVPFSPEAMNRRRVVPARGAAPNRNPAGPEPFTGMPGNRSRDNFDIAIQLAATPVKINFLALLQHAPKLRNELAGKLQQFHNEDVRQGNVVAPQIRPVPFSSAQAQAARNAPAGLPAQNGVAPMEHMWEAEEAYFAHQPTLLISLAQLVQ